MDDRTEFEKESDRKIEHHKRQKALEAIEYEKMATSTYDNFVKYVALPAIIIVILYLFFS